MPTLLTLVAALGFAAAQAPPSDRPVAERVQVDAVVGDARGRPIDGLGIADFSIHEDGSARAIESVKLVRSAPRLVTIFLDEFHTAPGAADRVRSALARFVRHDLAADDLVVVV